MADAYTVNLNLTKPEVGASSNTWGTKLNADLDVVDSLFSGVSTVAYSLKIGSANTLSVAGLLSVSGTASVSGTVTGTGTFNLLSAVVSVGDANFSLKDTADSTKIVKFEVSGVTTSTTRTVTFPDADITLVGAANTQTLTNKTLTNAVVGTQSASDNSTKAASTAYADAAAGVAAPSGVVNAYAGSSAPTGWLLCDGASYTTTAKAALFAVIAYTYGGSGANFNVPDIRGRVVAGVDGGAGRLGSGATGGITGAATLAATGGEQSHAQTATELAAHTHAVPGQIQSGNDITGGGSVTYAAGLANNGTSGSTGSGTAANVTQPTIVLNYIIKA